MDQPVVRDCNFGITALEGESRIAAIMDYFDDDKYWQLLAHL